MRISPIVFISLVLSSSVNHKYKHKNKTLKIENEWRRRSRCAASVSFIPRAPGGGRGVVVVVVVVEDDGVGAASAAIVGRSPSHLVFSSSAPVFQRRLRSWGKGVVTHPPQDVRIWSMWKFPISKEKEKNKETASFPSQTLHSKTGNLLWWWMPRPKQKRESRAPTISFKSQRRRRGKGRAKTATARQHVGGPPDPVVKHHGVAYPHGHGDGGAARDLLVPRAGRTP